MFHHNKERNLPSFGIIGCLLVTIAFIAFYFMWQRDYAEEYAYSGPERPLCIVSLQENMMLEESGRGSLAMVYKVRHIGNASTISSPCICCNLAIVSHNYTT